MTEQTLLRLAMVLQNQAPTTLNKYICNLAEATLLDFPDGISSFDLLASMNAQFSLSFTEEELKDAITKKGNNRISIENGLYKLSPHIHKKLDLQTSLSDELYKVIHIFIEQSACVKSEADIYALLLRYFYYCFIPMLIICDLFLKVRFPQILMLLKLMPKRLH